MPLYEFKCEKCKKEFEELISSKEVEGVKCPSCHTSDVKKLLSSGSIKMGRGKSPAPAENCGSCCMAGKCGMES